MFTIGVFAIIFDEKNRVLLCHRTDYDLWNLPWGGLEKWESPWKGVIREVKEETWFDVEVVKMSGIYSKPKTTDIVMQFICKIIGWEITLNDEADKIEYFDFDKIPSNIVQKQIIRIKNALDNPNKFYMQEQFGKWAKLLMREERI